MRVLAALAASLLATPTLAQEKHVVTDASVRTMFSFKAPAAAVEKLLPAGWQVDAPTSGPAAGANLRITSIDGVWALDPEGKPQPNTGRNVTVGVPVKRKDSEIRGQMLFGGFTTGPAPGVYSVSPSAREAQATFRTALLPRCPDKVVWVVRRWWRCHPISNPLYPRRRGCREDRCPGLFRRQAGVLSHLPLYAGCGRRAWRGRCAGAREVVHVQGHGSKVLALVRWQRAIGERRRGAVLFAAGVFAGVVRLK